MTSRLIKLLTLFVFMITIGMGASCITIGHSKKNGVPPGQMKKATGSQSAKPFAPGQQKKKD